MNQETIVPVVQCGDSVALLFSKTSAASVGLRVGEFVMVSAAGSELMIRKCDPVVSRQLAIAKQVMEDRCEVLRRLAE
jgi:death on curing protein